MENVGTSVLPLVRDSWFVTDLVLPVVKKAEGVTVTEILELRVYRISQSEKISAECKHAGSTAISMVKLETRD